MMARAIITPPTRLMMETRPAAITRNAGLPAFQIHHLNGPAVQNKGMALFPRKINGLYAMPLAPG